MTKSDPEGGIFLSHPHTSNGFFFFLTNVIVQPVNADMGLVQRKPVFGVSDKARFKPVSSATETS